MIKSVSRGSHRLTWNPPNRRDRKNACPNTGPGPPASGKPLDVVHPRHRGPPHRKEIDCPSQFGDQTTHVPFVHDKKEPGGLGLDTTSGFLVLEIATTKSLSRCGPTTRRSCQRTSPENKRRMLPFWRPIQRDAMHDKQTPLPRSLTANSCFANRSRAHLSQQSKLYCSGVPTRNWWLEVVPDARYHHLRYDTDVLPTAHFQIAEN